MILLFGLFVLLHHIYTVNKYYEEYGEDFLFRLSLQQITLLRFNVILAISTIIIGIMPF